MGVKALHVDIQVVEKRVYSPEEWGGGGGGGG